MGKVRKGCAIIHVIRLQAMLAMRSPFHFKKHEGKVIGSIYKRGFLDAWCDNIRALKLSENLEDELIALVLSGWGRLPARREYLYEKIWDVMDYLESIDYQPQGKGRVKYGEN